MTPPPIRNYKDTPEGRIQHDLIQMLRMRGWFVLETHGNMYQCGFPDLYATHSTYGSRWIEVKNSERYSFTPAQIDTFPKLCANGSGVWILVGHTNAEYEKLWHPPNWHVYLQLSR